MLEKAFVLSFGISKVRWLQSQIAKGNSPPPQPPPPPPPSSFFSFLKPSASRTVMSSPQDTNQLSSLSPPRVRHDLYASDGSSYDHQQQQQQRSPYHFSTSPPIPNPNMMASQQQQLQSNFLQFSQAAPNSIAALKHKSSRATLPSVSPFLPPSFPLVSKWPCSSPSNGLRIPP